MLTANGRMLWVCQNKLLPNVVLNKSTFKEVSYYYLYSAVIIIYILQLLVVHYGYFEYKNVFEICMMKKKKKRNSKDES